jgi:hypothetical protein
MLRSRFPASVRAAAVAGAVAGVLALGIAAPASARPASGGDTTHPEWGHVKGKSGVLKHGCHTYSYSYSINPPPGQWAIETFIVGPPPPRGAGHARVHLANGAFIDGYDPENGVGHYILCMPSTRYGKFAIRTRLSVQNGPDGYVEGWLPVAHYRLHAPRHHR